MSHAMHIFISAETMDKLDALWNKGVPDQVGVQVK